MTVMRSKNEVLCAAAGRLAAERSEADKPAKAHKTIFAPNNIYSAFFLTVAIGNCMVKLIPLLTFVLMKIFKPFLEQSWKIF
jgi:hypothetical protein